MQGGHRGPRPKTQADSLRQFHHENHGKPHWLAQFILPLWTKMNQACRFTWRSVAHLLAKRFIEAACRIFQDFTKLKRSENMETRSATFHKCTSTPTSNNLGFCFWTPCKVHNVADLQQSKRSVASEEALRFPSMAICVSTWSTPNSQVPTTACTGKHADETASAKSGIVCACRCVATVAWNTCHNN